MVGCLLVAAEVAVLYFAFWYLYLRKPKQDYHIVGDPWGKYPRGKYAYGKSSEIKGKAQANLPPFVVLGNEAQELFVKIKRTQANYNWQQLTQKLCMLPAAPELVFDHLTNTYIEVTPASYRHKKIPLLLRLVYWLNRALSQLNVRT